jgi:hypothetical protein
MNRLSQLPTLRINPAQKISLNYKRKIYQGIGGDTIATALYANGIRIFSRSLKYHRPRGLYSLDGECSNTRMEINGIPNVCTENTLLKNGMTIKAQNVIGTAENDLMGFMDRLDWAMPAGFYYRTMHKPAPIWPIALKQVRKAAGLGKISPDFQMNGKYEEIYPKADVCVIGGGPAGMSAALTSAKQGLRVILLESRPWLGGFLTTGQQNTAMASIYSKEPGNLQKRFRKHPTFVVLFILLWLGHTTTISSPPFKWVVNPITSMNAISKSGLTVLWWRRGVLSARCFLKITNAPVSCRSAVHIVWHELMACFPAKRLSSASDMI